MTATIESIGFAATHDGEFALAVVLRFPNGGTSQVQILNEHLAPVMAKANVSTANELVGMPWCVLNI
ncbi:hypothetical protein MB02_12595 [Croceicoccus estronivorus]|nr:hypothetical protein MB02_12595 [Croceicoccus estronivorus]